MCSWYSSSVRKNSMHPQQTGPLRRTSKKGPSGEARTTSNSFSIACLSQIRFFGVGFGFLGLSLFVLRIFLAGTDSDSLSSLLKLSMMSYFISISLTSPAASS
uniref:(northern house mosquito) hypothetical protein n=1 Tax=Culex pipiens TaxID=7175 RepID=A0A8D8MTZ6_CULPI